MSFRKLHTISALALAAALLFGTSVVRLAAQTTAATILGTVTDSTGAAVPNAKVRVTNTGTAATQDTESDSDGRYRVPALPIGDYQVEAEKTGFQTLVHQGITLTVGADAVVDFALQVGQVTQTITVSGQVSQVETTSTAISNTVEPIQMRELPLNGRNFEQLILLSPGVTIHQAIGYTALNGFGNAYSVSGSRTRGQWELLDDNDVMNWQGRGSGAGVLGTQLGVDAIAEFQVLTNTYSSQYGGNGAVITSVTRSGSNSLHGSAYEFIRNSALDARNFFDPPKIPLFQKNQFGGTLGGPIKKDKMFFFVNYEGIRQDTGVDYPFILPDAEAHFGFVPNGTGVYTCVNNTTIAYNNGGGNSACAATIPGVNPGGAPKPGSIAAMMNYFPMPSTYPYTVNLTNGLPNGLITAQETAQQPGNENYVVGRYDWTLSTKDSFFTRYLRDSGTLYEPFAGGTLSPIAAKAQGSNDRSLNNYLSIEEKHIWSNNVISSSRIGYVRTLTGAAASNGYSDFAWQPNLWGSYSSLFPAGPQGSINILSMTNPNITRQILGGGTAFRFIQNKYSAGEDIYWNKGAHSLQFGVSAIWVQSYGVSPTSPGAWTFANMTGFLTEEPVSGTAVCNGAQFAACSSIPTLSQVQHYREIDFGFYVQDTWKVRSNVTLNLGLRYSPETNPLAIGGVQEFVNMPLSPSYNPTLPMPGCATPTSCPALAAGTLPMTLMSHVYLSNPTLRNFEPRVGIAWDPFKDHKTSVRAGYGIFMSPVLPYDYTSGTSGGGFTPLPYITVLTSCNQCSTFPLPPSFTSGSAIAAPLIAGSGVDPGNNKTPYIEQYNLSIQHEIARNMMISLGYVGSHSVHLDGIIDENPSLPDGVPGAIKIAAGKELLPYTPFASGLTGGTASQPTSATGTALIDPANGQMAYSNVTCPTGTLPSSSVSNCTVAANSLVDPNLDISPMRRTTFWGTYNSLEASFIRRLTNNLQTQVSYTWAACLTDSSGTTAFENGLAISNPWDPQSDKGNCGFLIRHDLSVNGTYFLPFKGNRLFSGWELSSVFTYHTGSPISMSTGWNSGIAVQHSGPFPNKVDVVTGCNQVVGSITQWFNPACYTQPPIGEDGNVALFDVFGPDFNELDTSLVKNTKITERFNVQFRAEIFNLFNRVNFRNPGQPMSFVFSEAGGSTVPATCAALPSTCSTTLGTLGQLNLTNGSARQIQFGLKFVF